MNGGAMTTEEPLSTDAQLAVLRVKMDQLIEISKTRGEDHETRLRKLEERKFPLPTISVLLATAALFVTAMQYVLNH